MPSIIGPSILVALANIALQFALSLAAAELSKPPGPEAGKRTVRQEQPPRRFGTGRCRVSGPFMLREAQENRLTRVIAMPEGPVDHYGRAWLNDDEVTITGGYVNELPGERYPDDRVQWLDRLGEDTETAYAEATAEWPSLWPSTARGDGVPSMLLICRNGDLEDVARDFPNGEPDPSREAFYRHYDWRDPAQDIDDNTTWTHSRNAIVGAVNICWRRFGMDWDAYFAPNLDLLTAEADVCDETVELAAGGTEPRYEMGFFFDATNSFADVLRIMLDSMDGWFGFARDGSAIIRCGHVYEPEIAFGDEEVIDWTFDPEPMPSEIRNALTVSFTDPANAYSKVQTTSWVDETSILANGEQREDFYPHAVQSNGQVRRLGKRKLAKMNTGSGELRCRLSTRRAMGERYVTLNISESDDLFGVVVELGAPTIDLPNSQITWPYTVLPDNLDAWDPDTEEGDGPTSPDRPTPVGLDAPEITDLDVFFEDAGAGDAPRIEIEGTGPDRDDLTWFARWRVTGATVWVQGQFTDIAAGASVTLQTDFVTAASSVDVEIAYRTGGGVLSPWSTTTTVDTTVPSGDVSPPTDISINTVTTDNEITFRYPVDTTWETVRILRDTDNVITGASIVSGPLVGALGAFETYTDTPGAGTFYYWAIAYDGLGNPSTPVGPVSGTTV